MNQFKRRKNSRYFHGFEITFNVELSLEMKWLLQLKGSLFISLLYYVYINVYFYIFESRLTVDLRDLRLSPSSH